MTVNVCSHLYVRVPHVFLHIFQGKSTVQKQTCTTVPKLMETDVRQVIVFQQQGKMRGYVIRGKGLAVRPFENKIVFFIQSKMSANLCDVCKEEAGTLWRDCVPSLHVCAVDTLFCIFIIFCNIVCQMKKPFAISLIGIFYGIFVSLEEQFNYSFIIQCFHLRSLLGPHPYRRNS